jgi:hypothetical protein
MLAADRNSPLRNASARVRCEKLPIKSPITDIKRLTRYTTPRNICDCWEQNIMRDDVCCTTIIDQ